MRKLMIFSQICSALAHSVLELFKGSKMKFTSFPNATQFSEDNQIKAPFILENFVDFYNLSREFLELSFLGRFKTD